MGKTDRNFRGLVTDFKMKQSSAHVTLEKSESRGYYKGDNWFPQIIQLDLCACGRQRVNWEVFPSGSVVGTHITRKEELAAVTVP